jgi:lipopolysaccharide export system permease protein
MIISGIIVKEWFKSFIGAVFVLFLLITTADLINGFLQGKEIGRVFLEYTFKMPDLMGKMLPICCLIGTLFSLNKLKAHSELISILAAGYSYLKIYFLIGACASIVMAIQFYNLGFLQPSANSIKRLEIQKSRMSEGRYLTRSSIEGGRFWYKSQNYFASFTFFDTKTSLLKDFEIYFFNQQHKSEKILKSSGAVFKQNGLWTLSNVTEITSLDDPAFPLQTQKPEMVISLKEIPEDFGEFEADLTTLSFFKLYQFVSRLSKTGINVSEYQIILLNKVFLSFICFVFALIPLSSIFNPNRRSSSFGKNVVQTLLITIVFWVLYSSSVAFGNSGSLSPWIATGIVPLCFFSFVIWTYLRNRKLSI